MVNRKLIITSLLLYCFFIAGCKEGYPPLVLNGLGAKIEITATLSNGAVIYSEIEPETGLRMGFEDNLYLQEIVIKTNNVLIIRALEGELNKLRAINDLEFWLVDNMGIHSISRKKLIEWNKKL